MIPLPSSIMQRDRQSLGFVSEVDYGINLSGRKLKIITQGTVLLISLHKVCRLCAGKHYTCTSP